MELNRFPAPEQRPPAQSGCLNLVFFTAAAAWIVVVVTTRQASLPYLYIDPGPETPGTAAIWAAGAWFLLALPLLPLSIWWRDPIYKAIFRTWALASGLILIFLPVYFTGPSEAQTQATLHIALGLAYCGLLLLLQRRAAGQDHRVVSAGPWNNPLSKTLIAVAIGAVLAYPWLAWGAFGSLLDSLLGLVEAIVFGLAAGLLLHEFLYTSSWSPVEGPGSSSWVEFVLAAISAGITLFIIASATAFGFGGMQSQLMEVLPSLGGVLTGLSWIGRRPATTAHAIAPRGNRLPTVILVALAAAAPIILLDPDELSLIVASNPGELLEWAGRAANTGSMIGLSASALALLIILLRNWSQKSEIRVPGGTALLGLLAAGAWAGGGILYTQVGQPGFYGERLFVILKDQADVSSAASMQDYNARRQFVYDTLTSHAQHSQAELRSELDRSGIAYTPYYLVNGLEVEGDAALLRRLSSRPEVDRILESPRMRPLPETPPVETGSSSNTAGIGWNLTMIHAPQVWEELGITGEGIIIGQSDSGVQADHPELFDSYRGRDSGHNDNWFDPWYGSQEPNDIGGHGTHTLGTILGNTTGVAPGATWYACANLGRNLGNLALYLDCMQFMLAPFPLGGDPFTDGDPSRGAHISNNSWGCPEMEGCDSKAMLPAVIALRAAGIFMAAAAGNTGPGCSSVEDPPAIYDPVFSVGAINREGDLADFSSLGPVEVDGSGRVKPDLVAPGVQVFSSMPGSSYTENSGTSMAAPHVSGVVALMWSANPALIGNIDRTEQILIESAQPYQGTFPDCSGAAGNPSTAVGYGVLDAYAAVQMAIQEGK